MMYTHFK